MKLIQYEVCEWWAWMWVFVYFFLALRTNSAWLLPFHLPQEPFILIPSCSFAAVHDDENSTNLFSWLGVLYFFLKFVSGRDLTMHFSSYITYRFLVASALTFVSRSQCILLTLMSLTFLDLGCSVFFPWKLHATHFHLQWC